MEDQTQAKGQSAIENHQTAIDEVNEGSSIDPRPSSTRRSGGPRTAKGKRRSSQNARKHGLYTDESFLEGAALELGEDPRQFQRILKGLIEARHPVGALELAVVEDIALLLLKKARLDKAELAVQVCNLHQHDLERRKQMIQVGHANSDAAELDVREHGLRRSLSSPGQYEQVLTLLGSLLAMIDQDEFGYRMQQAMRTLYGTEHTLRGAELDTLRYKLSRTAQQDESFEPAKKAMTALVAEEIAAVGRQYELFLHEHVASTRAARVAATAPSHAQWAAIIRQQNSLHRQMERKIRLLMELQRERRELDETAFGEVAEDPGRENPSPLSQVPPQSVDNDGALGGRLAVPLRRAGRASPTSTPLEPPGPSPQGAQEPDADMPEAGTSAPPKSYAENSQNRGNELEDMLQIQGIAQIAPSKRTGFWRAKSRIGVIPRSTHGLCSPPEAMKISVVPAKAGTRRESNGFPPSRE